MKGLNSIFPKVNQISTDFKHFFVVKEDSLNRGNTQNIKAREEYKHK